MKALVDAVYTRLQPLADDTDPAYVGAEEVIVRGAKLPDAPSIIIEPPETPQQDETLDQYRWADTVLSIRVHTTPSKTPQQLQHEDETAFDYVLTFPSIRFPNN